MTTAVEYKKLSRKIERLAQEIEELQQVLQQWERSVDGRSERVWQNWMRLTEEISARWRGPNAVEEIKSQRSEDVKI